MALYVVITYLIFQQDRAPCHTAVSTKAWFEMKNIEVIPWPSQTPDLNPIDIWDEMKAKIEHCRINTRRKESFILWVKALNIFVASECKQCYLA